MWIFKNKYEQLYLQSLEELAKLRMQTKETDIIPVRTYEISFIVKYEELGNIKKYSNSLFKLNEEEYKKYLDILNQKVIDTVKIINDAESGSFVILDCGIAFKDSFSIRVNNFVGCYIEHGITNIL